MALTHKQLEKRLGTKLARWPRCKRCKVEFEPGRINRQGHCPACADELGEAHPQLED